jgi:hypothetical protein
MTPTDKDREAAEAARAWCDDMNEPEMVQAFMRHRLAAEERGARMALEAGDRWLQQQYGLSPLCADLDPAAIVKGTPDE